MRHWFRLLILIVAGAPLQALGAEPQVMPPLPSRAEAGAVCAHVESRGPAIATELVKDGLLDANNDGAPDVVTVGVGMGTMRGDWLQFHRPDAPERSEPVVTTEGFEAKDYMPFGARWLPRAGRVYTLYFDTETLRHASYLGYIDANNTEHLVCDFSVTERETLRPTGAGNDDAVCRAVAQRQASYLAVAEVGEREWEPVPERRENGVRGRITVDFANAGVPTPLALLLFASGAGRGCDLSYFDAAAGDRVASSGGPHTTLMKLQDIDIDGPGFPGRCDARVPRWLSHAGLVYLDIASRHDGMDPFHEVRIAREGGIETRCKGDFEVSWQVKSMGAEFQ